MFSVNQIRIDTQHFLYLADVVKSSCCDTIIWLYFKKFMWLNLLALCQAFYLKISNKYIMAIWIFKCTLNIQKWSLPLNIHLHSYLNQIQYFVMQSHLFIKGVDCLHGAPSLPPALWITCYVKAPLHFLPDGASVTECHAYSPRHLIT